MKVIKGGDAVAALVLYIVQSVECGAFWQVTDLHVDEKYSAQASVETACHSDESMDRQEAWFGRNRCGLPWRTVQSAINFMAQEQSQPDFIVWTGDTAPYWRYPDWSHVFPKLERALNMLKVKFPQTPIYPAIGNHDAFPSDQFPIDNETFYAEYLYRSGWNKTLSEASQRTFKRGGYYMEQPVAGLKVIVLNTNLYYPKNKLFEFSDFFSDPTGQLFWLENILDQLEKDEPDTKILIVAHISPGFPHWNSDQTGIEGQVNDRLLQILSSKSQQLDMRLGHVFGHEHLDTFKVASSYEKSINKPIAFFISPAVYPGSGHILINPGVRLYTYNAGTLQDYAQYNFDLQLANELHRTDTDVIATDFWKLSYRASKLYNIKDLSGTTMNDVLKRLRDDDQLFSKYLNMTNGRYSPIVCDQTCKRKKLCIMGSKNSDEMVECQSVAVRSGQNGPSVVLSLIILNFAAAFFS